jgi:uncharacterized protein YbjT (DUF2867 family)
MIIICGATGKVGGTAARELRARRLPVRAIVRDLAQAAALRALGCDVAVADLRDEAALARAFHGATRVLALCPIEYTATDTPRAAHELVATLGSALERAQPEHVVVISDYGAHLPQGTGITLILRALEQRVRSSGLRASMLRSAEHMQNWQRQLRAARTQGELASLHHPVTRAFPCVSAYDVGAYAAQLLTTPLAAAPDVIHIEGPQRYSASDVAAAFAEQLARPVSARALPRVAWLEVLIAAKLSESAARLVAELQDTHNAGAIEVEPDGLVQHGVTPLSAAIRQLVDHPMAAATTT